MNMTEAFASESKRGGGCVRREEKRKRDMKM